MDVAVLTVTYRDNRFIQTCVRQFRPFVQSHVFFLSQSPWHGVPDGNWKETENIILSCGAECVVGCWESEAEQRNAGVMYLRNFDWILIVDTDERYEEKSIRLLLQFLEKDATLPAYGIGRILTYWKDTETVVDPEESGGLIVAIRPTVQFVDKRCINQEWGFLPQDIVMHHLSYVRTNEEMKRKIETFEHHNEIVDNWYEEKWLNGNENLHPVHPESFKRIKKVSSVVSL